MQRLEVSCALRLIYTSLGAKGLTALKNSNPIVGAVALLYMLPVHSTACDSVILCVSRFTRIDK